jgi:hypothetical protein
MLANAGMENRATLESDHSALLRMDPERRHR